MPDLKPDHLIVRYLSNEATPAEQEKLFDWVSRSKENQKVFNEYVNLWSSQDNRIGKFNLEKGLKDLNSKIDVFEESEKKKTVFWNRWNIAAAIVLLMVSGYVLFHNGIFSFREHQQLLLVEKSAADKREKFTLSDGSVITLNKSARLQYPEAFIADTREVYLSGEAFFEVAKDSLRPFIIHANGITTTVLGTSFNVNATGKTVIVSVATGKVKVSDGRLDEILQPYEKAVYRDQKLSKEATDFSELDWKERILQFNDTNLQQAAEMIAEEYNVSINFKNEAVQKCLITGRFKNQKLENILQAIEFSNDVTYVREGNTILLSGKGCESSQTKTPNK